MPEQEWFIRANSFAAPFVSDESFHYQSAPTADEALSLLAATYEHPCGLYAANAYPSADAFHKGEKPVARWRCNHEIAIEEATKDKSSYGLLSNGPGDFEIDGEHITVAEPKGGKVVP